LEVVPEVFDDLPSVLDVESRVVTTDMLGSTFSLARPLGGIGGASTVGEGNGDCFGDVFGDDFGEYVCGDNKTGESLVGADVGGNVGANVGE
jgi:hypothetical protein